MDQVLPFLVLHFLSRGRKRWFLKVVTRTLDSLHECATKQICRSCLMLLSLYGPGSLMNVLSTSLNSCLNDFKLFWGLSERWSVNSCSKSHLLVQQINPALHVCTVCSYIQSFCSLHKCLSKSKPIPFLAYLCRQGSKFFLCPSSGLSRPRLLESLGKRLEENLGPAGFWVWIFESPQ